MNVFEYKKRYDPELGRYVKKNIYSGEMIQEGAGLTDFLKKGVKKAANWGLKKVGVIAGEKAGKEVGKVSKKAGNKITQLLKGNEGNEGYELSDFQQQSPQQQSPQTPMTPDEINERINRLMSGGKLRRKRY